MHERVQFITHQGKKILFINLNSCTEDQLEEIIPVIQSMITSEPPKSVLSLSDWTGAEVTRSLAEQIRTTLVRDKPHVKRTAFVGVDRVPKVFLDGFKNFSRRDFTIFKSLEEAKDWLVKD